MARRDIAVRCFGVLGGNVATSYITMFSIKSEEYPEHKGLIRVDAHCKHAISNWYLLIRISSGIHFRAN